jgi:hypothetical protein
MSPATPTFAVLSLPRSGSTAVFRVLSLHPHTRIEYEPDFGDAWREPDALNAYWKDLLSRFQGIKHVWDPNGWPFVNKLHRSSLESLAQSGEWVAVNASIANRMDRLVVLRRKDRLARVLSDLLSQQTDLWGHSPESPHSDREVIDYREKLASRALTELDEEVIAWYLEHATAWEDRILERIPSQKLKVVYYEDLFDAGLDPYERASRVEQVGEWLGIPVDAGNASVQAVLLPTSKINDMSNYVRIPNFERIVSRFGGM